MGREIKSLPNIERLKELFRYDPKSGEVLWVSIPLHFKRAVVGDVVGTVGAHGYRVVGIDRNYYYLHRVIWKMMTGENPVNQIDHADGNKLNNQWSNLRAATNGQNRFNTRLAKNNRSGIKGVCFERGRGWKAYIAAGHGQVKLGRFKNKQDAINARRAAAEKLHGEFMRVA